MAKKTAVKKTKRRLKKSVRRSFAAVLMVTAIAVAAIPVPENYAEDGETPGTDTPAEVAVPYEYNTNDYDVVKLGVNLKKPDNASDIHKTHYIFLDGGTYRMEWQYEFFNTTVSGESKGIICGYNDTYPVELLQVSTNPIYDYYTVLDEQRTNTSSQKEDKHGHLTFEEFKSKACTDNETLHKLFTCNSDPIPGDTYDEEFKKYFPAEYEGQVSKAKTYKEEHEKWVKDRDAVMEQNDWTTEMDGYKDWLAAHPEPQKPEKLEKYPNDFSSDDEEYVWRLYYCDTQTALGGYILVKVADSERTTQLGSTTTIYSYVPRRIDMATKTDKDDENGFRTNNNASFIGIGDGAFGPDGVKNNNTDTPGAPNNVGVQNVTNIELPDAIKYIGDSAFAGSFIGSIRMVNVSNVGNYAFKNCPKLSKVEFVKGVTNIGKEAFYGIQNLKAIDFPDTITYIGPGAFAECTQLSDVDFSKLSLNLCIDDYAFYNDVSLNKVNFVRAGTENATVSIVGLGKGAFAVKSSVKGNLTDFVIPQGIDDNEGNSIGGMGIGGKGLGDYLLAGRTNLLHVTMSENYGSSKNITLPDDLFFNCISLEWVAFPDTGNSCGFVKYNEDLFDTVSNPDFYVQGPKYLSPSQKLPARPRESTWGAKSAASDTIPYVYFDKGVRYVEVSDGIYLECIDDQGVLISCVLRPNAVIPSDGIDLIIPAEVANITVTGIASNCFSDVTLNEAVKTLTILDGSKLETINDSVFANWKSLQKVYVGDSVKNLGKEVFYNDTKLKDITFNTPDSVAADFVVGENAFKTNGVELTFHGIINGEYAPYRWAVDANNVIDSDTGIRVCYKSLAPTSLTVMYDSAKAKVTLLDYPKYADVENILGESYATKKGVNWKKWVKLNGEKAKTAADFYKDWMEREYYAKYAGEAYDAKREAFAAAYNAAKDPNSVYNDYTVYGPWVSPDYCDRYTLGGTTGGGTESGGGTEGGDTGKAIYDWFFEPITVYAANGKPAAYFEKHPYDVFENYQTSGSDAFGQYQTPTSDELAVINASKNIVVPDGVTSIDVKGFLDAKENGNNAATYLSADKLGFETSRMYKGLYPEGSAHTADVTDRDKSLIGGLFSGYYDDFGKNDAPGETIKKGNDRLESIDLNGVTYLPKYAFDNCENLRTVKVGAACTNIGTLPFRGCTALTDVVISEENPKYLVERDDNDLCKRIVYSRNGAAENGDPLYKVEECLETRGANGDSKIIDSAYDALLSNVNELAEGAFSSCNAVEEVNLTDAVNLVKIPKRSFKDCAKLYTIKLPMSVNKIEEYAFYNADLLQELRIPGREVSFTDNVFKDADKSQTRVFTYEDSAARRYADTNAVKYNLKWEDIGDLWEVNFYDMDGVQIGSTISVEGNTRLKKEQIPPDPVREGYVFDTWVGTGGITVDDYITMPTNFIAKYNFDSNGGPVNGKFVVEFHDGVDGTQLAGRGSNPDDGKYYIPVGKSFAEMGWSEPLHQNHVGYEPAGFSSGNGGEGQWTQQTVVNGNLSIIALYKASATISGGTTNTPSGGTTNTPGATTSSGKSTSSKNSSSSNSSSSTSSSSASSSTTSTTSGAGQYTVFVESGSGSGSYAPGTTVIIQAAIPAAGMRFDKWTTESNGVTLASVSMAATTFTMPSNNVSIKANYVEDTIPPAANTGGGGTGSTTSDKDTGNTKVDIEKPGISNRDLATANVNGSTDNFIVKISETDAATQAVAAALTNKYGGLDNILYYAMDITLWDSTGAYQLTGDQLAGISVDITIPIPDALVAYGGNNMAGAVINGDQLESLNENFTTINGVPCIRFRASHFSPYTIYVDTGNLTEGMIDVTPKTGDPIHPKWFLSLGLACLSVILFMKRDKKTAGKAKTA